MEYEARQKAILDYNQSIYEAEQSGREQGEFDKSIRIAQNLISLGSDVDFNAKATNLSVKQIQTMQDNQ